MYITFIRPVLEYASVVWDGCNMFDMERLEKVQLSAARIVTGLPILASTESLYTETGLESLISRRNKAKLITMFKIHTNQVPEYLSNIIPPVTKNVSIYHTRNSENYSVPISRLELYKKSFVPDTIRKWNSLKLEVREATSLNIFKKNITESIPQPPTYFSFGKRTINILHTKLRHNCILNYDLYRRNIIEPPNCICGQREDVYHFCFVCKNYVNARNNLFELLFNRLEETILINSHLLLWGSDNLSYNTNCFIFSAVQKFIKESGRFNN